MMHEETNEMLLAFLTQYFPVKRLRDGRRFKRGILIEGRWLGPKASDSKFFLKSQSDLNSAFSILYKILVDVFGFTATEVNPVLLTYLNVY